MGVAKDLFGESQVVYHMQNCKRLLQKKARWVTISTDEYESMKATIETLSSPDAMRKIIKGERELAEGRGKTLKKVQKELEI
jgi:hypothetical protein